MRYAVEVGGWMAIYEGEDKRDCLAQAKAGSTSASMQPSDVTERSLRPATVDDIAWYQGMGGVL